MDQDNSNILLIDDCEAFTRSIKRILDGRNEGWNFHFAHNEKEALAKAKRLKPEVIILDLSLDSTRGPESGLSLIPKLFRFSDCVRIIVLTGADSTEWGVRSISAGAASFICKPAEGDHLAALVEDGINVSRLMRENKAAENEMLMVLEELGLKTKSEKMARALEEIAFAAATPSSL